MVFAVPSTVIVSVPVMPSWLSEIVPLDGGSCFTSNEKSSEAITLEHVGLPATKTGWTPSPDGGPGSFVVVVWVCEDDVCVCEDDAAAAPACTEVPAFVVVPADTDVDESTDVSAAVWSWVTGSGDVVGDALSSVGVSLGETVSDPFVDASVVGSFFAWLATAINVAGPTVNANRKQSAAIARRLRRCRRGSLAGAYAHPCSYLC
jgi:hypothetical protein